MFILVIDLDFLSTRLLPLLSYWSRPSLGSASTARLLLLLRAYLMVTRLYELPMTFNYFRSILLPWQALRTFCKRSTSLNVNFFISVSNSSSNYRLPVSGILPSPLFSEEVKGSCGGGAFAICSGSALPSGGIIKRPGDAFDSSRERLKRGGTSMVRAEGMCYGTEVLV